MKLFQTLAFVLFGMSSPLVSSASILTFTDAPGSQVAVPQSYGDDLAGTPNVDLSYSANNFWVTYIHSVTFPETQTGTESWSYTFTAEPNYAVSLISLDYGHASQNGVTTFPTIGWTVKEGLTTLASGDFLDNAPFEGTLPTELLGGTGNVLTLTLSIINPRVGGDPGIGITNIVFSQAYVPEPSTAMMFVFAALPVCVAAIRRRNRRS